MHKAERGRSDAGNAAGLSNGHRAHALEGFPHLAGETADGAVLDPLRDRDAFGRLELFNGLLLLIEVACELDFGLDCARFVAKRCPAFGALLLKRGEWSQQRLYRK